MPHSDLSKQSQTYLARMKGRIKPRRISTLLNRLKRLKVLVIGDTILDTYVFTIPKGRAIKDPILSVEYVSEETYAGGVLAIANHIGAFVDSVKLVTTLGSQGSRRSFVKKGLEPNVELCAFTKKNACTTVKKRYIDLTRNQKMFKIEYMTEEPITDALTSKITRFLEKEVAQYDAVIVGDFGHGFINEAIRSTIEDKAQFLSVNAQSNSANMGYNYASLYRKPDFMSLSEDELRLPVSKRFLPIEEVLQTYATSFDQERLLVTLGSTGCAYFNDGEIYRAPVLTSTVTDTVGAGDAVFAVTSLCTRVGFDDPLIPFMGNCAGAIAANVIGNKESITRPGLMAFVRQMLT